MALCSNRDKQVMVKIEIIRVFEILYGIKRMSAMVKYLFRSVQKKRYASNLLCYLMS